MNVSEELNKANIDFAEKSETRKLRLRCVELAMGMVADMNARLASKPNFSPIEILDANSWVSEADILYQFIADGSKNSGK